MEYEQFATPGYSITDDGIRKQTGGGENKYICRMPIVPTALLWNEDSRSEKVELSYLKGNRWRKVVVPRGTIASKSSIVKLADWGLSITSENAADMVRFLYACEGAMGPKLVSKEAKSVMGWIGETDHFMPYSGDVAFDGDEQFGYLYRAITERGTLDEWADFVAPLRKSLALRLTMAASFASPLIDVIGENPFVFHLWGGTGTGKSVALLVAMSIWGDPNFGKLTRTMNMTANSMLSTAAFLKNLPFAGDELQTIKTRWGNYDNLIMQITEGVDRGRMSYDRVLETKSWKCSFLFSGEEPCIKAASGGGAKNRVVEVECAGKLVTDGNGVANYVKTHYGTAGPEFLDTLDRAWCRELYDDYFSRLLTTGTTDKQAGAAALMLTADRIASTLFWPQEHELSISDIAPFLSSADEVDVSERAYSWLCDTIAENSPRFHADSIIIWGVLEGDYCYINRTVIDRLLTDAGFDLGSVLNKWERKGYIVRNKPNALRWTKRIAGTVTSCLKILLPTGEVRDEDEDEEDEEYSFYEGDD